MVMCSKLYLKSYLIREHYTMNNDAVLIYLRLYDNILKCLGTFVHNFAVVGKAIFSGFKNTSKIVISFDARCKRFRLLVDVYPHSC